MISTIYITWFGGNWLSFAIFKLIYPIPSNIPLTSLAGHAFGIWICGCSLFCKRELWASKSAGLPTILKVAFSQKGLIRFSFLQTDEPNYFPELEHWFFFHSEWLKSCKIRTWNCSECSKKMLGQLQLLIWQDLSHFAWKNSKF